MYYTCLLRNAVCTYLVVCPNRKSPSHPRNASATSLERLGERENVTQVGGPTTQKQLLRKIAMFNGKTHDSYGHFNGYVEVPEGKEDGFIY